MSPVAPAVTWTYPDPSASRLQSLLGHAMSNSSVSPLGGEILLLELVAKKPKTTSSAVVVVTEGATIDPRRAVKAPLCESMGDVPSMPLKSRIAPPAEACEERDQL